MLLESYFHRRGEQEFHQVSLQSNPGHFDCQDMKYFSNRFFPFGTLAVPT